MKETAIYVHIPFCKHKCIYCDFYSITTTSKFESYLESLLKEIKYYAWQYSSGRNITSIFFGGGTPSLMDPEYIGTILRCIKENFTVSSQAEITLETNPGTVDKEKFKGFFEAGINRISIGIQSFDDNELKFLTRIHSSRQAEETVFCAYDSGFNNINLDLIFNLPAQSRELWQNNMERAISLPVKHISAYSLILEPGTILNKMVLDNKISMQGNEIDAELYECTIDTLERHGFSQYEVSNFAQKGYECVHNNTYWRHGEYIGFGTSAHSFMDKKRWWNFRSLSFYQKAVDEKQNAVAGAESLTKQQLTEEFVMLALRSSGLSLKELAEKYGTEWYELNKKEINLLKSEKFVEAAEDVLKLTKKGRLLCDEILTRFNLP